MVNSSPKPPPSEPDREAEAKAKQAQAEADYEFERPVRDTLGAARAVESLLDKAMAMALIARCMAAKPSDPNNGKPC